MLDSQQERALEELFQRALDQPPDQREAFVRQACANDAELGARLRELLAQDARGTSGVLSSGEPQQRIGSYKLVRLLGEGGMGTVHLAEQDEPVHRTVALKTIRIGGGAEVLARFDAERQALARLGHPNVAEIYESGTTESGLPWFAMEYCAGRPLDQHCDRERLDLRQRVQLLLPVCAAVQHAHTRGILHRDLKPANVLITQRDGLPVPKVIDFGLARGVAEPLARGIDAGDDDRPLGTWLYMSPEQADPRGDVDARTDVWALGALLYELLCGETPFPGATVGEVAAQLVAAKVLPPSERCARPAEPRARNVAQARRTTPAGLARKLRGDLDAIALKALERDRTRRYSTPLELAADLRAWLAEDPVSAVEPSALYRFGKLVRRRRAAAVLVLIASVATTGGLAYGWLQAARARDAAIARRERLQRALERAFARAELMQIALLVDDPDKPLRELLEPAEKAIQGRYRDSPLVEAAVRGALGSTWLDLGDSERARQQLQRAWDLIENDRNADDMERFLVLDALLRTTRSGGERVGPELSARCLELSLRLLQDDHPELCGALRHLVERARSADTPAADLTAELEHAAQVVPREPLTGAGAALVTRALSETAVALYNAGRAAESDQLSRKLEAVARRNLDPESSAWLYFLWRFAAIHKLAGAPLEQRTHELAQQLLDACRKRGLHDEHWLVREAKELGASDAGGASEGAGH
jgi:eukaryotic-like serine/threonine-protein kinase